MNPQVQGMNDWPYGYYYYPIFYPQDYSCGELGWMPSYEQEKV